MSKLEITSTEIQNIPLWEKTSGKRIPFSFDLEITARCNNNCRHCYINIPAGDKAAKSEELTYAEIESIADQAADLGAIWCLITGGEPLLRPDFGDIYLMLKRKGLLISIFTNATLINEAHISLFKEYPPRDIEVTVYGATQETYERVSRLPGSFSAFRRGLDLLISNNIPVRLKAMAIRSNLHQAEEIAEFCRKYTKDYFRYDPVLHLRYDQDPSRNDEIISERLAPAEIVALEQSDGQRFEAMEKDCDQLIFPTNLNYKECEVCLKKEECPDYEKFSRLFHCGAGMGSFSVSYQGIFRLCSSLWAPETVYDLRKGTLRQAWEEHVPKVLGLHTSNKRLLDTCNSCPMVNLCVSCPAHAYLETGSMEGETPYFCTAAKARAQNLKPGIE